MIEIYNEKIQDLLIPIGKRPLGGLKVRESKTHGVYVEELSKHPVDSYDSIEERMTEVTALVDLEQAPRYQTLRQRSSGRPSSKEQSLNS